MLPEEARNIMRIEWQRRSFFRCHNNLYASTQCIPKLDKAIRSLPGKIYYSDGGEVQILKYRHIEKWLFGRVSPDLKMSEIGQFHDIIHDISKEVVYTRKRSCGGV